MNQRTCIRIAACLALLGTAPALLAQTGSGKDSENPFWTVSPGGNTVYEWRGTGEQRVRIGITMDTPGEALATQLGVDRDKTVLITQVFDGMPAAKAGLKRFDLVVAVDGKTPATGEAIRKALSQKKAGEILKLEVLRKGTRLSLEIAVEEADKPEKEEGSLLGLGYVLDSAGQLQPFARITIENKLQDAGKALQKALEELQTREMDLKELERKIPQLKNLDLGKIGELLGDVKIQLGKIQPKGLGFGYSMTPGEGGKFSVLLTPRDGFVPAQVVPPHFVLPQPPSPPAAANPDIEKRLDKLEERMDKMMEMLQKYLDRSR